MMIDFKVVDAVNDILFNVIFFNHVDFVVAIGVCFFALFRIDIKGRRGPLFDSGCVVEDVAEDEDAGRNGV